MIFLWDDYNVAHIGEHDVEPEEAGYVVAAVRPPYPATAGDGKWVVRGQTEAGRYLQVIYVERDSATIDLMQLDPVDRLRLSEGVHAAYILHARDLTIAEKRQLRRRRR